MGIENDDELRHLSADLKAEACAAGADGRRRAPAFACSSDDDAGSAAPADDETRFDDGHDGEASCIAENLPRDGLLGHAPETFYDAYGLVDVILHSVCAGCRKVEGGAHKDREGKEENAFHARSPVRLVFGLNELTNGTGQEMRTGNVS